MPCRRCRQTKASWRERYTFAPGTNELLLLGVQHAGRTYSIFRRVAGGLDSREYSTSMNLLNNLPQKYLRCFVSKRHLQAHTFCGLNDGLDGRFQDSAAAQFDERAVVDFMIGRGCGLFLW
jgi:hypothetical protein